MIKYIIEDTTNKLITSIKKLTTRMEDFTGVKFSMPGKYDTKMTTFSNYVYALTELPKILDILNKPVINNNDIAEIRNIAFKIMSLDNCIWLCVESDALADYNIDYNAATIIAATYDIPDKDIVIEAITEYIINNSNIDSTSDLNELKYTPVSLERLKKYLTNSDINIDDITATIRPCKYAVLSFTDGYTLSTRTFQDYETAYVAMKNDYDSFYDNNKDDNQESYITDQYAYAVHTSEDIYIWNITIIN